MTELTTTDSTDSDGTIIDSLTSTITLETATDSTDETDLEESNESSYSTCLCCEDCIKGDGYSSDLQDELTSAEQQIILDEYKTRPVDGTYKKYFFRLPFLKRNEEDDARRRKENPSPDDETFIKRLDWLHVKMPNTFNYTAAIERNNVTRGLLHSLLRHYSEWTDHIPEMSKTSRKLGHKHSDVFSIINNISGEHASNTTVTKTTKEYIEEFEHEAVNNFKYRENAAFSEMQMLIYDFILNNTTEQRYRGETCNEKGDVAVVFNTTDKFGTDTVMIFGMDKFVYQNNSNLRDERPFRFIITVFFKSPTTERYVSPSKLFPPLQPNN
uniref:SERPIN domain-containing protein n=1 Tax=Panagrellus redivivus TaxID=6233 RepID=A0A7E4VEV7_PANRE